ncbi:MAG: DNA internalization-related competence protein ComEC/Rec2 [Anaerolineae bacterium]|nr:DNA internalization-related competence protein ComEC/Rec2 [Anaerolineae bacterium]
MTLILLTIAWLIGIATAHLLWQNGLINSSWPTLPIWAGIAGTLLVGTWALRRWPPGRLATITLLLAVLGIWRYQSHPLQPSVTPNDLAYFNGDERQGVWATIEGTVVADPEVRDRFINLRVQAEQVTIQGVTHAVRGLALVRAPRFADYAYGDRVRASGLLRIPPRLGDFDYRAYLARQGVHSVIDRSRVERLSRGGGSPVLRALYHMRRQAQLAITRLMPEPAAALLSGILLGIGSSIPSALYDTFNATATSHILVISGFNITIVAGALTASLGRLVGRRRATPLVLLGITLYVLLVGADAAVVRAGIMGGLGILAWQLGRQSTALVSLAASALVMTAINPLTLWDLGFQFSAMATLGLILFVPPLQTKAESWLSQALSNARAAHVGAFLNDGLIVTLAAQLTTAPLVAYYFGRLSLISLFTNFLILPVQPYIMTWGGAATLIGLMPGLQPAAQAIAYVPWLCLAYTVWVVETTARLPFASLELGRFAPGWLWGYYAGLALVLAGRRHKVDWGACGRSLASRLPDKAAAGLLSIVVILIWLAAIQGPDGLLHVFFLDVGQGDAILIQSPGGRQVLIDGGPSPSQLAWQVGRHLPFWDRSLDVVVLTHPDGDHMNGLIPLIERYSVSLVVDSPLSDMASEAQPWIAALERQRATRQVAQRGTRIHLGDGVWLDFLHPAMPLLEGTRSDDNNNSTVIRLGYGRVCFLLTGDLESEGEKGLMASGQALRCPILKVSHHGSEGATSEAFVAAVAPQIAVIQVGAGNRYGHPAAGTLERLSGARLYRTDQHGTIEIITDGERLWVRTER